eukprot:SAG31_NODE_352_length_17229_cov_9.658669_16_plen_229_part_00
MYTAVKACVLANAASWQARDSQAEVVRASPNSSRHHKISQDISTKHLRCSTVSCSCWEVGSTASRLRRGTSGQPQFVTVQQTCRHQLANRSAACTRAFICPPSLSRSSEDGREWDLVTDLAGWKHSDFPMSCVWRGRIWMMVGIGLLSLVFVPTIGEMRDFYREMQRTDRESVTLYRAAGTTGGFPTARPATRYGAQRTARIGTATERLAGLRVWRRGLWCSRTGSGY